MMGSDLRVKFGFAKLCASVCVMKVLSQNDMKVGAVAKFMTCWLDTYELIYAFFFAALANSIVYCILLFFMTTLFFGLNYVMT